jgi:peptidoglycan-associated lipoprotein
MRVKLGQPKVNYKIVRRLRLFLCILVEGLSLALLSGCPSKTPVAQTPPPPAAPTPSATIEVAPASVQAGQPITITWKTENATDVSIEQLGAVDANGSQTLTPTESTTYRLTAKGAGGVQESVARVTVVAAAAQPSANSEEAAPSDSTTRLDVFFDSDDFSIRPDQTVTIKSDADFLKEHTDLHIVVEGHCDEMGSAEYNLALGDKRAYEVKTALEKAGINAARIRTISYGKERPGCTEQTDVCWKLNRRAHIAPDLQR